MNISFENTVNTNSTGNPYVNNNNITNSTQEIEIDLKNQIEEVKIRKKKVNKRLFRENSEGNIENIAKLLIKDNKDLKNILN